MIDPSPVAMITKSLRTFTAMKHLPRAFYTRRTLTVAKDLLGKYIVRKSGSRNLIGMIVETEAYRNNDPASHSFRGMTARNSVMFRTGGFLYVYFTYGMHYCANVVTYKEGYGEAVLIRAVQPLDGIGAMMRNRGISKGEQNPNLKLTNGPAKFAEAFRLTTKDSGTDLTGPSIYLTQGISVPTSKIVTSTRIGIRVAMENRWRFYLKDNPWVSKR